MASETPEGWTYNPSTWSQRVPIVVIAIAGFFVAAYLGMFQLELIPTVWEPFFGKGSETILKSGISHALPIPDAILGAIGYLADAVTGMIGGRKRWRTSPWMVILFGIAVGPLGGVSLLLVVLQPVMFDSFCTLCLVTALASIVMIGPAMDEVLASLQYVRERADEGGSWWAAFWGLRERPAKRHLEPARVSQGR